MLQHLHRYKMDICIECQSNSVRQDYVGGAYVCTECGLVQGCIIDDTARNNISCASFEPPPPPRKNTPQVDVTPLISRATSAASHYAAIKDACARLILPVAVSDLAISYFEEVKSKKTRLWKTETIYAACIYEACQQLQVVCAPENIKTKLAIPYLKNFNTGLRIVRSTLEGRLKKRVYSNAMLEFLEVKSPQFEPFQLEKEGKMKTILNLLEILNKNPIMNGKASKTKVAAVMWYFSNHNRQNWTLKSICSACNNVSTVAVKQLYNIMKREFTGHGHH